ncbi:MAG: PAS domain S-box protein [Candidatus Aminicenantes bacterium]|nr:MAG: PAS domain S-box protein [Candidatus Aminicenantes bacterium]
MSEGRSSRKDRFFETLVQASNDGIIITDTMQNIIVVNQAFCSFFGRPLHEVKETGLYTWLEQMEPGAPQRWAELEKNLQLKGTCRNVRFQAISKQGVKHLSVNASLVKQEPGKGDDTIISIWRDISRQKQTEGEELFKNLSEQSPDMIYVNSMGKIVYVNKICEEKLGYSRKEFYSDDFDFLSIIEPKFKNLIVENYKRHLQRENIAPYEYALLTKDKKVIDVIGSTNLIKYKGKNALLGIVTDITELKRTREERQKLEERLLQAQKMEAIGNLAGGIAHDFNNILGAIIGYAELVMDDIPEGDIARHNLERILTAANRAAELVKQILTFSRRAEKKRTSIYVSNIIKDALSLLRASLPATIEIRQNIQEKSNPILGNPTQIHQVIINICANAAHAMREKGGILEITLKEVELDSTSVKGKALEPGRYQCLTISDTGRGMTPGIKQRIFEPYFTTKQDGEGTGMGLAVVHGIVKSHQGDITVYSEPGKGTTFHVYLPTAQQKQLFKEEPDKPIPMGNERILFVDDEEFLVETGKEMLQKLGYEVDAQPGSIEALEAFRENPHKFDLVITDQTMPNMTGLRLAKELKRIRPDIPIILCTGFSETINEENFSEKGISAFVMKPILKKDIARVIRNILDGKPNTRKKEV